MTLPEQVSFDQYLDTVFASSKWVDACVTMLSAFLESIDACRDDPDQQLPDIAPSIVDQVAAMVDRAQRLEQSFRATAEERGPAYQTPELGAALWWTGMSLHKAMAAVEGARKQISQNAWWEVFFEVHALLHGAISAISLLALAEGMIQRMEAAGVSQGRPN